jgi:cytochrome bd-type quinol oxidase subunit 2
MPCARGAEPAKTMSRARAGYDGRVWIASELGLIGPGIFVAVAFTVSLVGSSILWIARSQPVSPSAARTSRNLGVAAFVMNPAGATLFALIGDGRDAFPTWSWCAVLAAVLGSVAIVTGIRVRRDSRQPAPAKDIALLGVVCGSAGLAFWLVGLGCLWLVRDMPPAVVM